MIWVTATQLIQWSDGKQSEGLLPLLIRRLIIASVDRLDHLAIPGGDSVFRPGWDGRVNTVSASWPVPEGFSVWEFGTSKGVVGKMVEDFNKRTDDPKGVERAGTTFVLVSSRRWPDKKEDRIGWAKKKVEEGGWRNVVVLDADDLETWLDNCAGVASWFARELGAQPEGVEALQTFWNRAVNDTEPALTPDIILSGRDMLCNALQDFVEGDDSVLQIKADTREEAVLLVAAWATREDGPTAELLFSNAVIIHTEEAWRQITASVRPLILIPIFSEGTLGVREACDRGHSIILPHRWDASESENKITAPWLDRENLETALKAAGFTENQARDHAANSGRSLQVLMRRLAIDGDRRSPPWAKGEDAQALVPLLFAGRWHSSNLADREVIAGLAGQPYENVEERVGRWLNVPDAPLRRYGDVFLLTSPMDAWSLLANQVTPQSWARYQTTLIALLKERDPKLDLPAEQRWAAGFYGKDFRESGSLRAGLVEQLARLAGIEDRLHLGLVSGPADIGGRVLNECLTPRDNAERWLSIHMHLPELAEASPDLFLDCLEALVDNPSEAAQLFDASESFMNTSPHVYLMWAIEQLRWFPGCLPRCAELLVRLAALDPGANSSPRPASTFEETFHLAQPENNESFEVQLGILEAIGKSWTNETWPLLVSLLESRGWRTVKYGPKFRGFVIDPDKPKTWGDLWARVEQIIELLSVLSGDDQQRWVDLFDKIGDVHETGRTNILDYIEELIGRLENPHHAAIALYQRMTAEVRRHRAFSDTDWAIPEEVLQRIELLADAIMPADPVEVHCWLFAEHWPDHTLRPDDAALAETRSAAFKEVRSEGGLEAIVRLAEKTNYPGLIGEAAALSLDDPNEVADILEFFLKRSDDRSETIVSCFVSALFRNADLSVDEFIARHVGDLGGREFGKFARGLPSGTETWDAVDAKGDLAEATYWRGMRYFIGDEADEISRAALSLLKHDQVYAAIQTVGLAKRKGVSSDLVIKTLKRVPEVIDKIVDQGGLYNFKFDVVRMFECLDENGDIPDEEFVRLEFEFFPLIEHTGREFPAIKRHLENNPEFFIELICMQYKDETGASDIDFDGMDEAQRKSLGHKLFNILHDFDSLPGLDGKHQDSEELLQSWIGRALQSAGAVNRSRVVEQKVGDALARTPEVGGQSWPPNHVCNVLEEFWSEDIGRGFSMGAYNKIGARFVGEGEPDAARAAQHLEWAEDRANSHPHVARLLRQIAMGFQRDAAAHKREAELRRQIE